MLGYKKYQVEVINPKDEVQEVVLVGAWSEVGAVEKAHKKVNGTNENSYRITKL